MTQAPCRILIVDDDAGLRAALSIYLAQLGFATCAVASSAEALIHLAAWSPDLLVLDLALSPGGLEGLAICRTIRADPRYSAIPIIIFSAHSSDDALIHTCLTAGANRLISKQAGPIALSTALTTLLTTEHTPMMSVQNTPWIPTVLLIEDVDSFAELLTQRFALEQLTLFHVRNQQEARQRFQQQSFDLAIVDWKLGEAHRDRHAGLHMISWLREQAPQLPIIVLTGEYEDAESIQIAYSKGATRFCAKSDTPDRWIAEARALLRLPVRKPLSEAEPDLRYGITSIKHERIYIHGEELHGLRPGMVKLMSHLVRSPDGVSWHELSSVNCMSEGTIKKYKSRIARALRDQFGADYADLITFWNEHSGLQGYRLRSQPRKRK